MAKHNIDAIARVCHEANRAYCLMVGDPPAPAWDEFAEAERQVVRTGVLHALHGDADPVAMHDSWCKAKLADGWTLAPRIDREAKTHPNLVPYADLPLEQRRKDRLFVGIIKSLTVRM